MWTVRADACIVSEFDVDDDNSWQWISTEDKKHAHMGQKNTTYYFDAYALYGYEDYIYDGISMWGNNIVCTEVLDPDVAKGTFAKTTGLLVGPGGGNVAAHTQIQVDTSSMHITNWTITICSSYFAGFSEYEKKLTIAHEIGHTYGLEHVNITNSIMYPTVSESLAIRNGDIIGMSVMTHTHTHSNYTYKPLASMRHEQTCGSCGGYTESTCAVTSSWHSGNTHYYEYDCPCGNYDLVTKPCAGNCIDIMEQGNLETE